MQAHGAEMMRIACILAVERGIKLCAPIHDASLIEAPLDQIDSEVVRLKECMTEASEAVLGDGKVCRVDADIVRYPDRYMDEHGQGNVGPNHGPPSSDLRVDRRGFRGTPTRVPRHRIYILIILL
jgi:hypothetical protein